MNPGKGSRVTGYGPVPAIDVINVYNVYKKFFVNAFIILSTFISIKIT